MVNSPYSMSFTSGTLLFQESTTVAALYLQLGDWETVRQRVNADNLLQKRTQNAAVRLLQEVISRLKQLSAAQQQLLVEGTLPEQNVLLWLAFCKRYRFVYDFATAHIPDKMFRRDLNLLPVEYDRFFADKAAWHPEVARVSPTTQKKQRQVIFKTMRQANLLNDENQLQPLLLTQRVEQAIKGDDPNHLTIFPIW